MPAMPTDPARPQSSAKVAGCTPAYDSLKFSGPPSLQARQCAPQITRGSLVPQNVPANINVAPPTAPLFLFIINSEDNRSESVCNNPTLVVTRHPLDLFYHTWHEPPLPTPSLPIPPTGSVCSQFSELKRLFTSHPRLNRFVSHTKATPCASSIPIEQP